MIFWYWRNEMFYNFYIKKMKAKAVLKKFRWKFMESVSESIGNVMSCSEGMLCSFCGPDSQYADTMKKWRKFFWRILAISKFTYLCRDIVPVLPGVRLPVWCYWRWSILMAHLNGDNHLKAKKLVWYNGVFSLCSDVMKCLFV